MLTRNETRDKKNKLLSKQIEMNVNNEWMNLSWSPLWQLEYPFSSLNLYVETDPKTTFEWNANCLMFLFLFSFRVTIFAKLGKTSLLFFFYYLTRISSLLLTLLYKNISHLFFPISIFRSLSSHFQTKQLSDK